ncbi:MAG: hypothetical protein KDJ36_19325, partial [Hyphomicrobiaceae bacterium]|nr:hypothetical protein [Hyphomicrobiaceae bacterium]
ESWHLYRFDQLDLLIDRLEERSGRSLPRQADNYLGSGRGVPVEGALDLLPAALSGQPRIDRASFWTPDLTERVRDYFADDYALLSQIGDKP